MKVVRVAIVGLGYWGPNLVRNFLKIPNVQVSYLCDTQQERLDAMSLLYPLLQTTTEYNRLLRDESVDVIAIATPLSTHYMLAKLALQAKKHVFIEKPMTQTSEEGRTLVRLAKKEDRVLMVGHTFLYSSAIRKIKQQIDHKKLGEVYYYDSTRINLGGFQSDTNVLWDLSTHDLAIIDYLFPHQVHSLYVAASKHISQKHVEVANLFLQLKNQIFAHIHVSWLSPVKIRTILLGGSKEMIVYNDIEPSEKLKIYHQDAISLAHVSPFSPAYRSGDITIPKLSQEETMYNQLFHLITCVRQKKTPITDGMHGIRIVELLEAAEKSLSTKKEIIINE